MHYGVLGMKWGHHKAKVSNNSKSTKKNKNKNLSVSKKKIIDKGRKLVDAFSAGYTSTTYLSASLDAASRGNKALKEGKYWDYMKERRIADDYWTRWKDTLYK